MELPELGEPVDVDGRPVVAGGDAEEALVGTAVAVVRSSVRHLLGTSRSETAQPSRVVQRKRPAAGGTSCVRGGVRHPQQWFAFVLHPRRGAGQMCSRLGPVQLCVPPAIAANSIFSATAVFLGLTTHFLGPWAERGGQVERESRGADRM